MSEQRLDTAPRSAGAQGREHAAVGGFSRIAGSWTGVTLLAALGIAGLWLGVTGDLTLYVHPRYTVFTIVFSAIGLFGAVAGAIELFASPSNSHADDHGHERVGRLSALGLSALVLVTVLLVILLPPASLSPSAAANRAGSGTATSSASSSDDDSFAGIASTATSMELAPSLVGETMSLTGFVVADDERNFSLTRYLVTCCVVDARPVSIPVTLAGWSTQFDEGSWVDVDGIFQIDQLDPSSVVLVPSTVTVVDEPNDPYVY